MAASFECKKFATLININTSPGKAVFSGTLETDTAGMRGFSCVPVSGIMSFQRKKKKNKKIQIPSQPVKCKTQNICTYLQIIAI